MSQLGLGVMLKMLGGNEDTIKAIEASLGKIITNIRLDDEQLILEFDHNNGLILFDNGQSCCESRYMTCDDPLEQFIGATFDGVTIEDAAPGTSAYGEHEIEFMRVQTSKGTIVCQNHNEHNGYYGGFSVSARLADVADGRYRGPFRD
jgi:hypothetical protein